MIIIGYELAETDKAYRFSPDPAKTVENAIWLPKSQIIIHDRKSSRFVIEVPDWLAQKIHKIHHFGKAFPNNPTGQDPDQEMADYLQDIGFFDDQFWGQG